MEREIKFEYGFESVNGIVKKVYFLHEVPDINNKCDVWNVLPIKYVRQFTGLKDNNGKEIYEGDIIMRPYRDVIVTGTVVFSDGFSSFKTAFDSSSIDGVKSKTLVPFMPHEMDQIEIIGNIHENPE